VLFVQEADRIFAIPIDMIESCTLVSLEQIMSIEEQDVIYMGELPYPVVHFGTLLSLPEAAQNVR